MAVESVYVALLSFSIRFAAEFISLFVSLDQAHSSNAMNALKPNLMSAAERLDEIAEILAVGLMRARARQSSPQSADRRDSSLDCAGQQSGDPNVLNGGLE